MADWWDTGGGFSLTGGDTFDIGSYSPSDYSLGGTGGGFDFSSISPTGGGFDFSLGMPSDFGSFNTQIGGGGGLLGMGGGGGFGGIGLPGLLGLGGSLAGLAGTLMGGGRGATTTPQLPTAARAQIGQANQAIQPFALGQSPLQQMQMSLLQSIASGQGLPPGYAQLVEQAFQPKLGSLYEQATNAGRARGFYDAPATAPPGGAVLGPGLADLQGQMAAAKLGLMQTLPGLYNQPINQQIGAAQGQSSNLLNAAQLQRGQTQSQPLAPQIGQAIGGGLQGMGQAITMSGQQQSRPWDLYGAY